MGKIPNSLDVEGLCIKHIECKKNNGHVKYRYARFIQRDTSYYDDMLKYYSNDDTVEISICNLEEMKVEFPVHIGSSYYCECHNI